MIHSLLNPARAFLSGEGALILPELELLLFACGILLINRWLGEKEKYWNALLAVAGTAFSGFTLFVQNGNLQAARAVNPESPGLLGLHQSVLVDPFFLFFGGLFLAATALVILLSVRYLDNVEEGCGSCYSLLLLACMGMMLVTAGVDLIVVLLGFEIMGVSCFLLARCSQRGQGTNEAAHKYALFWGCSSIALGAGFLLLYSVFRTTNLGRIGAVLEVRLDNGIPFGGLTSWHPTLALVFIAIGIFLLVDAAPLHWFSSAVTDSVLTPVAAFLSTAAKTVGFVLLLRCFSFLFIFAHQKWIHVWGGVAIVSLLWGNVAALRQRSVKRLLAYGSVAHTGFLLLGLVAGNETGFSGMIYYLGVYTFMTAGVFGVLIVVEQGGSPVRVMSDLNGLYRRRPALALLLGTFLVSLAGIPPTAGFLAKYFIFKALIAAPHPELAAFAVVNALLAVYYYGRLGAHAWKKPTADEATFEPSTLTISSGQTVALTAALFVSLAAGLYPEPFLRMARYAFGQ